MRYVRIIRALISRRLENSPSQEQLAVAAFAVIANCDATSSWYRESGVLTPEQIATANWSLANSMLSAVGN